jgi:hypothetical protein
MKKINNLSPKLLTQLKFNIFKAILQRALESRFQKSQLVWHILSINIFEKTLAPSLFR